MPTPNMTLVLPVDHASSDIWDTVLDAVFNLIDAHDHTTGKGVKVPSAGIGVNADISFAAFALTTAKAVTFNETTTASVSGYTDALFVNSADHNLYFRNSSGTNVQITSGSTINVSLVGGIGGDYSSVSALLSYVDASRDYLLQQEGSPRPWAGLETGDIKLYQKAASISNAVTLKSPSALASAYSVTWPTAVPAATALVQMSAAGVLAATNVLANNQNLQLQGTGYVQRSSRTTVVPVIPGTVLSGGAGSISANGTNPGAVWAVSSNGYIPCNVPDADNELAQITSVTIRNGITGTGNVTLQLYMADWVTGLFISIGSSSALAINSGLTVSPTSPTILTPGNTLWCKVTTAGTNSGAIYAAEVLSTVP